MWPFVKSSGREKETSPPLAIAGHFLVGQQQINAAESKK